MIVAFLFLALFTVIAIEAMVVLVEPDITRGGRLSVIALTTVAGLIIVAVFMVPALGVTP